MKDRTRPPQPSRRLRGRWPALALAVVVNLAFVGVLVFSVSWRNPTPPAVTAELYAPPSLAPVAEPPKPEPTNQKLVSWKLSYTDSCGSADVKVNCKSIEGLGQWKNSSGTYGASTGSEITINKDANWGWCNDKHELVDALVHEIGHAIRLKDNNKAADSMNGSRGLAGHKRAPGARDSTEAATADTSTVKTADTLPPGGKKLTPYSGVVTPSPESPPFNLPAALHVAVQTYRPTSLQILGWTILGPDQIEWNGFIGPDADGVEAFFVVITYPESVSVRQGFLHVADDPSWDPMWRPTAREKVGWPSPPQDRTCLLKTCDRAQHPVLRRCARGKKMQTDERGCWQQEARSSPAQAGPRTANVPRPHAVHPARSGPFQVP